MKKSLFLLFALIGTMQTYRNSSYMGARNAGENGCEGVDDGTNYFQACMSPRYYEAGSWNENCNSDAPSWDGVKVIENAFRKNKATTPL